MVTTASIASKTRPKPSNALPRKPARDLLKQLSKQAVEAVLFRCRQKAGSQDHFFGKVSAEKDAFAFADRVLCCR